MRIYVCSPFSNGNRADEDEMTANRMRAMGYCDQVVKAGHAPLAPHVFYPLVLDERTDRERGVDMGMQWLRVCDEVWVFGDSVTAGMQMEVIEATRLDIPVRRIECDKHPCLLPGG